MSINLFRPDYDLHRLRWQPDDNDATMARFPYLRTFSSNAAYRASARCSYASTTWDPEEVARYVQDHILLYRQRISGALPSHGVESVILRNLKMREGSSLLGDLRKFLLTEVRSLVTLNLKGCVVWDDFDGLLSEVAQTHPRLRRLRLPKSSIAQRTLDLFEHLEELDMSGHRDICHVHNCAATLQVLYASQCTGLSDEGLSRAVNLRVLDVSSCPDVTTVFPFAGTLQELHVMHDCGVTAESLSGASRLVVLHVAGNNRLRGVTLKNFSFFPSLRELTCNETVNDDTLAHATSLVQLRLSYPSSVTSLAPFGVTLRCLDASHTDLADLTPAIHLVQLSMAFNQHITSLAPCARTLLHLDANNVGPTLTNRMLAVALSLFALNCSYTDVTSLQSVGNTLRHLVARGPNISSEALRAAAQLMTLDCGTSYIDNLTACAATLQEVNVVGNHRVDIETLSLIAPYLWRVINETE